MNHKPNNKLKLKSYVGLGVDATAVVVVVVVTAGVGVVIGPIDVVGGIVLPFDCMPLDRSMTS